MKLATQTALALALVSGGGETDALEPQQEPTTSIGSVSNLRTPLLASSGKRTVAISFGIAIISVAGIAIGLSCCKTSDDNTTGDKKNGG